MMKDELFYFKLGSWYLIFCHLLLVSEPK